MPKRASALQDSEDEDYDEGGHVWKRSRSSTLSQSPEPQQGSRTQRPAAVKGIATEAMSHISPAKKWFPSSEHAPGSMDALRESQRERSALAKNNPEEVKKLVDSPNVAKHEALINTPDILLAQPNAFNTTVHKLLQENGRLKTANTELTAENTKLTQDHDQLKNTNAELATRAKTAIQATAKCEQDAAQAKQDSEARFNFLAKQLAEANESQTKNETYMEDRSMWLWETSNLVARIGELEAQANSGKEQVAGVEELKAEIKVKQAVVDRLAKKLSNIAEEAKIF
ncbi:hypothetical protein LTR37_013491 [Vermiconidia calcicola]|uniref:Uncharacterized protein n=1 Tax=Vermiconidia calcicola TaxID=1690605 RepID=A0ACC3MW49_9PEZI|nr:hypothetical protein LTR37_013491 [Vermiconidia calcicola]